MNIKLNNRGFTLVELLAVMVILISISLVAVGGITESLTRRDKKECKEQQELAINAAKIYFSLSGDTSVTVGDLTSGGYFKDDKKIDKLKSNDTISIPVSGSSYVYSAVTGSCAKE